MSDETASNEQSQQEPVGDEQTPSPETAEPSPETAKKPRSALERRIVWGAIGVLLIVAAIQGVAAFGYTLSLNHVKSALDKVESGKDTGELNLDGAEKLMSGIYTKSEMKNKGAIRYVVYTWPGFWDYTIMLNLGTGETNPIVIGYQTNTDESEHDKILEELSAKNRPKTAGGTEDETADEAMTDEAMAGDEGGPGGDGPGGGGAGRRQGGRRGLLGQLSQESVQTDLELTDEQKAEIEEAAKELEASQPNLRELFGKMREAESDEERTAIREGIQKIREEQQKKTADALKPILSEEQFARLQQLDWRSRGAVAIGEEQVAAALKLNDEQKQKLQQVLQERGEARRSLGFGAPAEARQEFNQGWDATILEILTPEQKEAWEKMLGPPLPVTDTSESDADSSTPKETQPEKSTP